MTNSLRQSGFTLVELMVTLGIAALLLSAAVPSFTNVIKDNRMVTETNRLLTSLANARVEAVKRGRPVTVCARDGGVVTDGDACTGPWTNGFVLFVDTNANGAYDGPDGLIKFGEPADPPVAISSPAGTRLSFASSGLVPGLVADQALTLCDDRGAAKGKRITISAIGRPYLLPTAPAGC
ncbi:MAG: GspH/FimT family pseudopilin [Gammaproteobacteria bacterium]